MASNIRTNKTIYLPLVKPVIIKLADYKINDGKLDTSKFIADLKKAEDEIINVFKSFAKQEPIKQGEADDFVEEEISNV